MEGAGCEGDSFLLFLWCNQDWNCQPQCGISFRWHEAAGICIGSLWCWVSVTLLTPGSSRKWTWLVFLVFTVIFFFHQEDLPFSPIRVPRSHPQWSWCVLRLQGWQRIQSPSSHPKWTFQAQMGGNNLHVPTISNLGIWTCSLPLGSRGKLPVSLAGYRVS